MAKLKDKEETILNAAFEVFRKNGFTNASMKDIATKAGLGKGTLYEYFQNKEDLFVKVFKAETNNFFNEVNSRISDKLSLREILNEIIKYTQETLEEAEFFIKFMVYGEFFEMSCEVKQKLYETILSNREESVNILMECFKKETADGILREFDWEFAANFIPEMIGAYCNFKAHIMGVCWTQQQKDLDREKIINFILNGIRAK